MGFLLQLTVPSAAPIKVSLSANPDWLKTERLENNLRPCGKCWLNNSKILFPEEDDEGVFILPALDARSPTLSSGCWSTVEPNRTFPLVQSWSCRNEIFGGGGGDMYDFSYKTSPVFQSHNFWHTISWKCSLKDNCIRSSVIECQSFSNRKINIEPKYRVLMFLPSTVQVLCSTWYREVNMCRILMPFVFGINRQKEYCLSLAWILTSRYQSVVDDRMKIERTSNT